MRKTYILLSTLLVSCVFSSVHAQTIVTVAGNGISAYSGTGGPATMASLYIPGYAVTDAAGNVYIAEYGSHVVRKVDLAGTITLYAGTGTNGYSGDGGQATDAKLSGPEGLAIDTAGNLYINDDGNMRIRKVSTSGIITTVAGNGTYGSSGDGSPATAAEIAAPDGICLDIYGNLYITDAPSQNIRKVDASGIIHTIAGNGSTGNSGDGGPATAAQLNHPTDVFADNSGNLFFTDEFNNTVRKINATGTISTIAGTGTQGFSGDGGPAIAATFYWTAGIWVDCQGNIYVGDYNNNRIRMINPDGMIATIAGNGTGAYGGDGGPATAAELYKPCKIAMDLKGNMYIGDRSNERVRKIIVPNHAPVFVEGASEAISLCNNLPIINLDTLLRIQDSDYCQKETWAVVTAPAHGILAGLSATGTSEGGVIAPSGLSYTATTGYYGHDTIRVSINDGTATSTIALYVTINHCALGITNNENPAEGKLTLAPNPGNGTMRVILTTSLTEPAMITLYDLPGNKVAELPASTNKEQEVQLALPDGMYIMNVTTAHGRWVEKVVIAK